MGRRPDGAPPSGNPKRRATLVTGADRPVMAASTDPYLLRNLVWCGPCDIPMAPAHEPRGDKRRAYKCPLGCRTAVVLAEPVESMTWLAAERHATVAAIASIYRQSVLEMLLVKVIVGATADDVSFVWRT